MKFKFFLIFSLITSSTLSAIDLCGELFAIAKASSAAKDDKLKALSTSNFDGHNIRFPDSAFSRDPYFQRASNTPIFEGGRAYYLDKSGFLRIGTLESRLPVGGVENKLLPDQDLAAVSFATSPEKIFLLSSSQGKSQINVHDKVSGNKTRTIELDEVPDAHHLTLDSDSNLWVAAGKSGVIKIQGDKATTVAAFDHTIVKKGFFRSKKIKEGIPIRHILSDGEFIYAVSMLKNIDSHGNRADQVRIVTIDPKSNKTISAMEAPNDHRLSWKMQSYKNFLLDSYRGTVVVYQSINGELSPLYKFSAPFDGDWNTRFTVDQTSGLFYADTNNSGWTRLEVEWP